MIYIYMKLLVLFRGLAKGYKLSVNNYNNFTYI